MLNGPHCPSVVHYKVVFTDGSVQYPKLPGHADVWAVADSYAKQHNTAVESIERLY